MDYSERLNLEEGHSVYVLAEEIILNGVVEKTCHDGFYDIRVFNNFEMPYVKKRIPYFLIARDKKELLDMAEERANMWNRILINLLKGETNERT